MPASLTCTLTATLFVGAVAGDCSLERADSADGGERSARAHRRVIERLAEPSTHPRRRCRRQLIAATTVP